MSVSKENLADLKNNEKVSFSISAVELGFSILVGVATWFWLRNIIYSGLPYPCGLYIDGVSVGCDLTHQQAWEALGKPLFLTYVIPYMFSLAISSIFLLRSIRRDFRQFSIIANLALSIPILSFIGLLFGSIFSWYFLFIGLVLALIATLNSRKTQMNKWDWVSLAFNLFWLVIFVMFVFQYFDLYGD